MITFGINNNNDIYLDATNSIGIKKDIEALGDIYINKAQPQKGELIYNTEGGVDYLNTIFGEPCYPDVFQFQLINELKNTAETINITDFTAETENDVYSYTVNCQTTYGQVTING